MSPASSPGNLPRFRMTRTTGQRITFELEGVAHPESYFITYPQGLEKDLVKVEVTFMAVIDRGFKPEPETAEQQAERVKAEQAAALAEAVDQWQAARRDRVDLVPVFEIHRPVPGYQRVDCGHCTQSDGMEGTEGVPWPCATYTALTSRPESTAWEPQDAGLDDDGHPLVKAEGFTIRRDVYEALQRADLNATATVGALPEIGSTIHIIEGGRCATGRVIGHLGATGPFDGGIIVVPVGRENEYLPTHQDETRTVESSWHWPCDGELLAESEPPAPAPVTVINVTVQGLASSEQDFTAAIRRSLLRHGNTQTWQSIKR